MHSSWPSDVNFSLQEFGISVAEFIDKLLMW